MDMLSLGWTGISLSAYRVDPKTLMNSRLYSDIHRWAHELTNSFNPMYHRLHSPRGLCEALRWWRGKHLPGHSFEALMVYRGVSPTWTPQGVTCRAFQKCRIRDPKQGGSPGTWESAPWGNGPGSLGKGGQARLVLEERHSQDRGGHKAGWGPRDPNPRWPGGARKASPGSRACDEPGQGSKHLTPFLGWVGFQIPTSSTMTKGLRADPRIQTSCSKFQLHPLTVGKLYNNLSMS